MTVAVSGGDEIRLGDALYEALPPDVAHEHFVTARQATNDVAIDFAKKLIRLELTKVSLDENRYQRIELTNIRFDAQVKMKVSDLNGIDACIDSLDDRYKILVANLKAQKEGLQQ